MSSLSQRVEVLKNSRLLRKVSRRNLKALAEDLEERILPAGVTVVEEGAIGMAVFFLASGTCDVFRDFPRQRTQLGSLKAGDLFGEMAVLDPGPRTASVVTTSNVHLYVLTAWDFKGHMERSPEIPLTLMPMLARRFRRAHEALLQAGHEGDGTIG